MQQRKMKIAKFLVVYDKQQTCGIQKEGLSALPCFYMLLMRGLSLDFRHNHAAK
jgi:hypothetical protein